MSIEYSIIIIIIIILIEQNMSGTTAKVQDRPKDKHPPPPHSVMRR